MVGYGTNPPTQPHHRAASCPDRPASCTYDSAFNAAGPNPQASGGAGEGGRQGAARSGPDGIAALPTFHPPTVHLPPLRR